MDKNLSPEKLVMRIRAQAELAIEREDQARAELAKWLTDGGRVEAHNLRGLLEAQAEAGAWRGILRQMDEGKDVVLAISEAREDLTERLLTDSESQSTCPISNEQARVERKAGRQFLSQTRRIV